MATVLVYVSELTSNCTAALAEAAHRVVEAHTSKGTLSRSMTHRPDVVIIPDDHQTVCGEELLLALQKVTDAAIMMMGAARQGRMAEALFQGADAYLELPFDPAVLRSRVRALLRRSTRNGRFQAEDRAPAGALPPA